MKYLVYPLALLCVAGLPAIARVAVVFRLASPPLPVETGQQFALCAANVGATKADLTLQFLSVRTGEVVATRDLVLPPAGSGAGMPDPCLTTTSQEVVARGVPGAGPPLLVALVVIRHGLFSRASAATASVQVAASGPAGEHIIASVPLHLATLINGRNTPVETVQ
jgi:hypothetical protein